MNIVVGGGTGFIGTALCNFLKSSGHNIRVVSRQALGSKNLTWNDVRQSGLPAKTDVVINLSGRNIGEIVPFGRNAKILEEIYSSRIETTKLLVNASKNVPLKTFINASGVGYYRPDLEAQFTESEEFVDCGWITRLVREWEEAAQIPNNDIRQFQLRLGVVLSRHSPFIAPLYPLHFLGVAMTIGSGQQWISWIHLDDVVRVVDFLLSPNCTVSSGPVNVTAPYACRQKEFSKTFFQTVYMGRRVIPEPPLFAPVPRQLATCFLGKDRETLLLDGQCVIPKKLLDAGFEFKYSRVEDALHAIFDKQQTQ